MRKHRQAMRAEMQKARAEMKADTPPLRVTRRPRATAAGQRPAARRGDAGPDAMMQDDMAGGPRHQGKHHDGKRHGWHNERAERGEGRREHGMGGPAA